jgi:4-amino-4-deoxy-L-arabinose transferase-like glycosyltransferase
VCAVVALYLLVRIAVRGLSSVERRTITLVVGTAIVLRVALIVVLFASAHPADQAIISYPFDGDGAFMKLRALWFRNVWLGVPIEPHDFFVTFSSYGRTSYVQIISYIQYLLGPAPYAIHLFNAWCHVAGALLIHRMVRPSYGAIAALVALVVILFMPTLVMWSTSALKESVYFLLLTTVVFGVMKAVRGPWPWRWAGLTLALAATGALSTVRAGALFTVGAGIGIAVAGALLTRRIYLLTIALMLGASMWALGLMTPVTNQVLPALIDAATVHLGYVGTGGHSYQLLDDRFYSGDPVDSMTNAEAGRFVLRAVTSFIVMPLPQDSQSRSELLLIPQQIVWYGLVIFAVPGVVVGLRRDRWLTWLLLGMSVSAAGVISLNSGNVGTLVRIRDSIVPFVSCLGAVGIAPVLARMLSYVRPASGLETTSTLREA